MSDNFCAAPWSGLSIDPDGYAKVCCISHERVPLVDFKQTQGSPKFIEIRQAFIESKQHSNCNSCWDREKLSDVWESRRSTYQYDYFHNLTNPNDYQLEHLDLRWSNTCNLNCVYCSPTFSSKWASLYKLKENYRVFPTLTDEDLINLKVMQLAGGEPLLIKENLDVLSRLLEINPSVQIEVTSNITQINGNAIYEKLQQFDNVTFVVSFESTGKRFEYIRNGANWSTFQTNLEKLALDFQNIQFNMVFFPLSSLDIVNAINVALKYTAPENIFVVEQVGGHGFDKVSKHAVQYIQEQNFNQSKKLPSQIKQRLLDHVARISSQQTKTCLPFYDKFDRLTTQDHRSIFEELYNE